MENIFGYKALSVSEKTICSCLCMLPEMFDERLNADECKVLAVKQSQRFYRALYKKFGEECTSHIDTLLLQLRTTGLLKYVMNTEKCDYTRALFEMDEFRVESKEKTTKKKKSKKEMSSRKKHRVHKEHEERNKEVEEKVQETEVVEDVVCPEPEETEMEEAVVQQEETEMEQVGGTEEVLVQEEGEIQETMLDQVEDEHDQEEVEEKEEEVKQNEEEEEEEKEEEEEEQDDDEAETVSVNDTVLDSPDYRWTMYLNIKVIEHIASGFINATKLCQMYSVSNGNKTKTFKTWKRQVSSIALIEMVREQGKVSEKVKSSLPHVSGTYVHPYLIPHLALWCNPRIGYAMSQVIDACVRNTVDQVQYTPILPNNETNDDETGAPKQKKAKRENNTETVIVLNIPGTDKYMIRIRRYNNQINNAVKKYHEKHGNEWELVVSMEAPMKPLSLYDSFTQYMTTLNPNFEYNRSSFKCSLSREKVIECFETAKTRIRHMRLVENVEQET